MLPVTFEHLHRYILLLTSAVELAILPHALIDLVLAAHFPDGSTVTCHLVVSPLTLVQESIGADFSADSLSVALAVYLSGVETRLKQFRVYLQMGIKRHFAQVKQLFEVELAHLPPDVDHLVVQHGRRL